MYKLSNYARQSNSNLASQGANEQMGIMTISLSHVFRAKWTLHGQSDIATYEVRISIEGPERQLMSNVAPIAAELGKLEGADLSKTIGKSSLEAIALYIRRITKKHLDQCDRVQSIKVTENGFFAVIIGHG